MSKNFLYVIEVWEGKQLLYDAIRATLKDAKRRREELEREYSSNDVKLVRYKRVHP